MQLSLVLCSLVLLVPGALGAQNPKRGLAFAGNKNPVDIKLATQTNSVLSWEYDWGQSAPDYLAQSKIPYIPMQWGTDGIENFAAKVKASGAKTILVPLRFGFNEPDFSSQSNIDPVHAAQLWKQYIQPLAASGIKLGGPAITSAPSGRPWLASFLQACTGCTIDFIAIHWYGDGVGNFYDYIWQVHGQFPNYPIWITEFASTSNDDAVVLDFLQQTTKYLDSLDWIQAYAWFGFFRKESDSNYNLIDANGQLNAAGQAYITGSGQTPASSPSVVVDAAVSSSIVKTSTISPPVVSSSTINSVVPTSTVRSSAVVPPAVTSPAPPAVTPQPSSSPIRTVTVTATATVEKPVNATKTKTVYVTVTATHTSPARHRRDGAQRLGHHA
ncbi:hypothetical protein DXG03_006032 [Asterophora parasitica]|uniref:Asl1-like glycosyl hydrolase catalytic domain-containing protein n=1 Tax=Asterophora parasitica TaxID=117018 RepID=A0A9P7GE20_9AGAR|nr:hypothetical protein DXG03_006032 [Asterophora parasitica]